MRNDKSILILDHHGIGNVVMSLPLLRGISKDAKPNSVYVLLYSRERWDLLKNEGLNISPEFYSDYRGIFGAFRFIRKYFGKIDVVVGVPQVPAIKIFALKCLLSASHSAGEAALGQKYLLTWPVRKSLAKSIIQSQQEMLTALRPGSVTDVPHITLSHAENAWGDSQLKAMNLSGRQPLIAVHCSSVEQSKKWAPESFGKTILGLQLIYPKMAVISFGTSQEKTDTDTARLSAGDVCWVEGSGLWNLRQSLAMLSKCDLLISADTGVMHMASAVGTPTLSLFGPTSPERLAPIYSGGAYLKPNIPCHPCYKDKFHRRCPECVDSITPAQVVAKAIEILSLKSN